ncbi:LysM peptidoglycan-binding domain-containing protein [Paenibacillus sp. GbtcB18]|nr:LysM peptidoglycan-binding domain-containing protein [Paenibacillus sp. GbtcB18]
MNTYVVQPGDTLYLIANRHNTTVEALLRANNLSAPYVYVGQTLYIPA